MPKLIVGLGNPGDEYTGTRHNLGFTLLNAFADVHNLNWQFKTKFNAAVAEYSTPSEKIYLVKPQTYYNNSGETVRALRDFYKIENIDILVIHDELALPFGTIRTREQGSDAGNNGVKSITNHIGKDFARIRVGIWHEVRDNMSDANYVLGKFNKAEAEKLPLIREEVNKIIQEFIQNKITTTTWRLKT